MEKIAVVGLSCLFPGATTPEQFWENLIAQKDVISQLTKEQVGVDPDLFFDPEKGTPDRFYCKRSGFIRDFQFDPTGYRFDPEFLNGLDDIFKWSLYVARQALTDSGYLDRPDFLAKCGVILGNLSSPTKLSQRLVTPIYRKTVQSALQELLQEDVRLPGLTPEQVSPFNLFTAAYPSTLIPQALGLSGTSFTLDAACASPLYAVQLACEYLISRKADLMLAGAVSCSDPFVTHIGFSLYRAYPSDGVCRPLDQNSGGMITGEGAGMLALKRYSDAVRDGDKIYATILGVGLSNDGKGKHFLTPSSKGQKLAFERAYVDAGVNPQSVAYVECHATGTDLGDKTELSSMDAFFGQYGGKPKIGSVKSNLGHLLTAAGMPSMIKVILSMANGVIPPTINVREPLASNNEVISADQVVTQMTPWPQTMAPVKRAAVSAFGFGGTNAHLVLEQPDPNQPLDLPQPGPVEPIAIVGMDAFFGQCDGLDAFDRTIYEGKQHFVPVPPERWQGIEKYADLLQEYGFEDGQAPQGAYIESLDIDFLRFKIQPNLYEQPIPQQLLILKVADEALKNANMPEGGNVAVIVAMETEGNAHLYRARCDSHWQIPEALERANLELPPDLAADLKDTVRESICWPAQVNRYISYVGNIMASRISAAWDFTGPSLTISAGENSTFKALEVAQILLADQKVDAVVVGAVELAGGVENVLLRQKLAASQKGEPVPGLDVESNGWLVGEGAGAVVLKRVDRARQNADRIYATIDAISLGQEQTLTADQPTSPSPQTVAQTCETAFAQAGVTAADIGYLEVHGSGVPQEDWAEIGGITQAYRTGDSDLSCAIGTVKANIGHTFSASGIASLIKTALCVYHRYIPTLPQWSAPKHPELWSDSPFYVADQSQVWAMKSQQAKRVAAVSGLGLDGSCAHLILSEDPAQTTRPSRFLEQTPFYLFLVTGSDRAELLRDLQKLQQQVEAAPALAPSSTAGLTQLASQRFVEYQQANAPYTAAILGGSQTEVLQEIGRGLKGIERAFAQGRDWQTPAGSYFTPFPQGKTGKVAFVYPGAFMSYLGMGRDAARHFPKLYDIMPDASSSLADLLYAQSRLLYPRSLGKLSQRQIEQLEADFANDSVGMLVAGTVAAIQASNILKDYFNVQPQAAFGYSLGELTMLFSLGVWSNIESIAGNLSSSELFKSRLAGPKTAIQEFWGLPIDPDSAGDFWGTFVLLTDAETVRQALQTESRVYLTHVNTPQEVVIGGDKQACQRLIDRLQCDAFPLPISGILHCDPVRLEFNQLKDWATLPVAEQTEINFYTAATYGQPTSLDADSVARSVATALSQSCDFPRLINQAYEDGARIFVELGPGASCSRWIKETLKDRHHVAFTVTQRGVDCHTATVRALARLASHQATVNLSPLYSPVEGARKTAKSLIRTVTVPGALRIRESILSEPNRQKFAGQCVKRVPSLPIAEAVSDAIGVADWVRPLEVSFVPQLQQTALTGAIESPVLKDASLIADSDTNGYVSGHASGHMSGYTSSHTNGHTNGTAPSFPPPDPILVNNLPDPEPAMPDSAPSEPTPAQPTAENAASTVAQSFQLLDANLRALHQHQQQISRTTQAFLQNRQDSLRQMGELIGYQIVLSGQAGSPTPDAALAKPPKPAHVIFDEDEVLEVACGKLANVFGKEYEAIDLLPRCTRVPMPPYLFISRVTKLEAKRGALEDCLIETEYDIPVGAWYSTGGYMPCAVAIEASHSNIFLMSYIGVDFETQGNRVYRALGGTISFMDTLPQEGETMRCEVTAHDFSRMGDTILFTFTHKTYVGDKQFMQMECKAGFFSDEELLKGQGIPESRLDQIMRSKVQKQFFEPPLRSTKTAFYEADLECLNRGDFAGCFGNDYALNLKPTRFNFFPPEPIRMISRITSVDPRGGAWGLGLLVAEKDLTPDAWYFNCHFKDDFCIPGTLVGEGCGQLLAFYLLYLGLHTQVEDGITQPLVNQTQIGHYRGQILPTTTTITYRVEVTEIGLSPTPYLKAECSAIYDGKTIAVMKNLGLGLMPREAPAVQPAHLLVGNEL